MTSEIDEDCQRKMRVIFVNHIVFKSLAEGVLPSVSIVDPPTTVGLPNFPIEAC
jgi:hypothetical protein